jgi:hypothetical protein
MALSANTVWEVRTTGDDANGGGFVSGASGTDRSQQTAPHVTIDGVTITATVHTTTTQLNLTGHTVDAADVGNIVYISGGTATAGWYQITAVDVGNNRWTLDRSAGTAAQTATGRMGGCLATPGKLGEILNNAAAGIAGQVSWIKAGTYTLSNTTPNTAGGPVNVPNKNLLRISGYWSTRGDLDDTDDVTNNPVFSAGLQTTVTIWTCNTTNAGITTLTSHITCDGNSKAGTTGFVTSNSLQHIVLHCKAQNCTVDGFKDVNCIGCLATGCGDGFEWTAMNRVHGCVAANNTVGFRSSGTSDQACTFCLAFENADDGFIIEGQRSTCYSCTAHGNGGDGFSTVGSRDSFLDCVATSNGGYGYSFGLNGALLNCASYNNTSGRSNGTILDIHPISLSADPYTNSGSDDYTPNDTASAGALLRAASVILPGQGNYLDVGAVQHQDSGGGGGTDEGAEVLLIGGGGLQAV